MFCGFADVSSVCVFVKVEKKVLIFTSEVGLSIAIFGWTPLFQGLLCFTALENKDPLVEFYSH